MKILATLLMLATLGGIAYAADMKASPPPRAEVKRPPPPPPRHHNWFYRVFHPHRH